MDKNIINAKRFWNKILNGGKIISDKETEELHEMVRKLRKEKWERKVNYN